MTIFDSVNSCPSCKPPSVWLTDHPALGYEEELARMGYIAIFKGCPSCLLLWVAIPTEAEHWDQLSSAEMTSWTFTEGYCLVPADPGLMIGKFFGGEKLRGERRVGG